MGCRHSGVEDNEKIDTLANFLSEMQPANSKEGQIGQTVQAVPTQISEGSKY